MRPQEVKTLVQKALCEHLSDPFADIGSTTQIQSIAPSDGPWLYITFSDETRAMVSIKVYPV